MNKDLSFYKKKVTLEFLIKAKNKYSRENWVFIIPNYMSISLNAYISMHKDLTVVLEYLKLLSRQETNKIIKSSLMYSSLALYGKCFTDASQSKSPNLIVSQIISDAKLLETHEFLMNLRHKFLAHRGETDSEIISSFYLINKINNTSQLQFMRAKQISFTKVQIFRITELVKALLKKLNEIKIKFSNKVQKGMLAFEPKILSQLSINNLIEEE